MKQQEFEAKLQAACRDACRQDLAALDALTPVDAAPVRPARRRGRRPLRVAAIAAAAAVVTATGAAAVWPRLQVDRKQDALIIGLEEKAAAPETIPERMEFGYLPDGWTVTWDETADTEKTCRATLSWATPDCWYYVTLASTGYETVDRDTVLRILQGITP